MFVRWKRRRRKDGHHWERPAPNTRSVRVADPEFLLSASLVESYRNADGQPRQRTIAYLGSIRERRLTPGDPHAQYHFEYFWDAVDTKLGALQLPGQERDAIIATIEARVPRPTPGQLEQDAAERLARIRRVAQMTGGRYP